MLQRNSLKKELMELTLPRAIDSYMTALTLELARSMLAFIFDRGCLDDEKARHWRFYH
jgi:hypothetical protein